MQKHTPGPWSYQMEKRRQFGQTIHTAHIVPDDPDALFSIARLDPVTTRELAEANARLIAAAPQLLELARTIAMEAGLLAAHHNQPLHPRAWQNSGERWASLAQAAINAAS